MGAETVPGRPSKVTALLLGAAVLVLTTTLPYLTLINALFFAGIIASGSAAAWYYIMHHQIRLESGEAFVLGAMSGLVGGVLSVLVAYLLETRSVTFRGSKASNFWLHGRAAWLPKRLQPSSRCLRS